MELDIEKELPDIEAIDTVINMIYRDIKLGNSKRIPALAKAVKDLAIARAVLKWTDQENILAHSSSIEINPDDPLHRQKDYLSLAILFQTSVDTVKDNYDILVQQCREAGII